MNAVSVWLATLANASSDPVKSWHAVLSARFGLTKLILRSSNNVEVTAKIGSANKTIAVGFEFDVLGLIASVIKLDASKFGNPEVPDCNGPPQLRAVKKGTYNGKDFYRIYNVNCSYSANLLKLPPYLEYRLKNPSSVFQYFSVNKNSDMINVQQMLQDLGKSSNAKVKDFVTKVYDKDGKNVLFTIDWSKNPFSDLFTQYTLFWRNGLFINTGNDIKEGYAYVGISIPNMPAGLRYGLYIEGTLEAGLEEGKSNTAGIYDYRALPVILIRDGEFATVHTVVYETSAVSFSLNKGRFIGKVWPYII